jgi:hypothetical protein
MLELTIWRAAMFLESLVLFRGFRGRLLSKYPFFYAYIASVLFSDVVLYFIYMMDGASYAKWKWGLTFVDLILGYGIILEMFKHVLSAYPGAERFARVTGLVIFGAIFSFVLAYPLWTPGARRAATTIELQRDFWTVQAIFVFAIFGVVSYYRIPLGRNLKGMTFGYGLCLGVTLMALAVRAYVGPTFTGTWVFLQTFSYVSSLAIWVVALWAYHPNPVPDSTIRLEADYEQFVSRTKGILEAMRSHLGKAGRP